MVGGYGTLGAVPLQAGSKLPRSGGQWAHLVAS
jgi:hypothetical protein